MMTADQLNLALAQMEIASMKEQMKARDKIIIKLMVLCGERLPKSFTGLVEFLNEQETVNAQ